MRAFHEWLEGHEGAREAASGGSGGRSGDLVGAMVPAGDPGDGGDEETTLGPDDEATVEAINRLVQQLFREDEVRHTSEVTGVGKPEAAPPPAAAAASAAPDDVGDFTLPLDAPLPSPPAVSVAAPPAAGGDGGVARAQSVAARVSAMTLAAGERPRPIRYELVPDDVARARAAEVAHGHGAAASVAADASLLTPLPDWTEDDPELPPAFQQPKPPASSVTAVAEPDAQPSKPAS